MSGATAHLPSRNIYKSSRDYGSVISVSAVIVPLILPAQSLAQSFTCQPSTRSSCLCTLGGTLSRTETWRKQRSRCVQCPEKRRVSGKFDISTVSCVPNARVVVCVQDSKHFMFWIWARYKMMCEKDAGINFFIFTSSVNKIATFERRRFLADPEVMDVDIF